MEVEETVLVEVSVDSHCHVVTDAHHCTECVGAQTQMGILAHVLECLSLLLHGIIASAESVEFEAFALYFRCLSLALAFHQCAGCADAGTGGNLFEQSVVEFRRIDNNLYVVDCRAIVECYEIDGFAAAVGTHPSFHVYGASEVGALQRIYNFCSLDCIHCVNVLCSMFGVLFIYNV